MGNRESFYTVVPFDKSDQPTMVQAPSMMQAVCDSGLLLVDFLLGFRITETLTANEISICREPGDMRKQWLVVHGDIVDERLVKLRKLLKAQTGTIPEIRLLRKKYILQDRYWIRDFGDETTQSILKKLFRCGTKSLTQRHVTQLLRSMGAKVYIDSSLTDEERAKLKQETGLKPAAKTVLQNGASDGDGYSISIAELMEQDIRDLSEWENVSSIYKQALCSLLFGKASYPNDETQ